MGPTYIGLDCGTSALKGVLVDERERVLAASTQPYRPALPRPLWSEQDPDVWASAAFAALGELAAGDRAAMGRCAGIGLSGQMHGAVLLDSAHRPTRPAMLHNDGRAFVEARDLAQGYPELAEVVGVKPMAGFTAPKVAWVRRHEPGVFEQTRKVVLPKDYIRLALTGDILSDVSDGAGTWWLDEAHRRWSTPAFEASQTPTDLAPPLVEGSEPGGALRDMVADRFGLPRGTIVAGGGGDAAVGAVGLGIVRPGDAFISLGTSAQLIVASDRYAPAPGRLVHAFAHALPNRWYRMAAMLNGAGALAFAGRLFSAEPDALEREAAFDYEGPGEVMFLPYLAGERTPHDDPHARGVFFGLSNATTRVDCVRAVMEGVALTFTDARECVEEGEAPLGAVGLTGGGAKSALWTRLIAATLERTIIRYRGGDVGPALGAARLARLAAMGEGPEAVCKAPAVLDETAPEPALVDRLRPRVARFRSLYEAMAPQFAAAARHQPFDFG